MWIYSEIEPALKFVMLGLACVLALRLSAGRDPLIRSLKQRFRDLANSPWKAAIVLFLISLGLSFVLGWMRPALPWIHDEFSYLLASDTFSSGRLTNPSHPMWQHFESYHVLSQPSYMSKYPPANALFMAVGQLITGHPIVGVWFALALATVATFWMLRVWTTPVWALWGGLVVATHGWILHAWGQSYWGGAVAFLAGALLYGGARRIVRDAKIRDAVLCGMGLIMLANSRPMEGFLVSLPVLVLLLIWLVKPSVGPKENFEACSSLSTGLGSHPKTFRFKRKFLHAFCPVVLIGLAGLAAMGAYNKAVTGYVTELPYKVHDQNYSASSLSLWKPPPAIPEYNHDRMATYYIDWARARQVKLQNDTGAYWSNLKTKFYLLWCFFPIGMGITFCSFPALWKDRWSRLGIVLIGALLLLHSQMASSWIFPHYLAPALGLFFAISVQSLRRINVWQRQKQYGPTLIRIVLIFSILKLVPLFVSYQKPLRDHPRSVVKHQLLADPSLDLVLVSYAENYRVSKEWVYNEADIDAAQIVWARDMGDVQNEKLLEYFAGRKVWRWHLEDDEKMMLTEFSPPIAGSVSFASNKMKPINQSGTDRSRNQELIK